MALRHAVALALIVFAPSASARRADSSPVIALAREYVRNWVRSLSAVVAEERYTQTLVRYRRAVGVRDMSAPGLRTLVSDVLLVHAAGDEAWLMFRDVLTVDGEPVRDRQRRFDDLFARPDANLVATARRIADEGARYNLGSLFRNLNTPATALAFVDAKYESSVRWGDAHREELNGRPVVAVPFEQRKAPFAIRSVKGQPISPDGRLWIEPASGRIVRTELNIRIARMATNVRLVCDFGAVPKIEPWVPLRMSEEYQRRSGVYEDFKAQAVYANHRVFKTSTRIISEQQ